MGWSSKYKKSIDCNNPKGFSQKAHCAGKKKRNENIMKLSELKEQIRNMIQERSINAISKAQQKNLDDISKALDFYKKNKHTDKKDAFIKVLKKLGKEKERLAKELDAKVSGMYKNAEYKGESVNEANTVGKMAKRYKNKDRFISAFFAHMKKHYGDSFKDFEKDKKYRDNIAKIWDDVHGVKESINEGPSTEEKRIAMLAVKKQAKYRNVSLSQAIQDQINALEDLKRQYRGK